MDTLTAFLISAAMIMLNGAVLGMMHRDLPAALLPSALSWRVGTLLQAGGCVLLGVQRALPAEIVLPLAHAMLMLGITGYWRALRQFYSFPESPLIVLPAVTGAFGIVWFTVIDPSVMARILIAASTWFGVVLGCIATLRSSRARDAAVSRRVLTGVMVAVASTVAVSGLLFGLPGPVRETLAGSGWVGLIAPMIAAVLPVVGTTAFLQLGSERIRRQWEHAASTDHLTGLANRRTVATAGERRVRIALQGGQPLAVAVIDIDHFKPINDRFGHEVGDEALKHVACLIAQACSAADLVARQGGEEFVAVLEGDNESDLLAAAARIRLAVEAHPFSARGRPLTITVSIGLALLAEGDQTLDDLLRRADHALYAAKAGGRNRLVMARAPGAATAVARAGERIAA